MEREKKSKRGSILREKKVQVKKWHDEEVKEEARGARKVKKVKKEKG